jgi:hypothetical protein
MQHVLRIVMGYELAQRLVLDSNGGQRRQGNLPIPFRFFLFFAGIRHRLRVSITASGRRAWVGYMAFAVRHPPYLSIPSKRNKPRPSHSKQRWAQRQPLV